MELKYDKFGECGSDFYSSNCTFMELKFSSGVRLRPLYLSSNCTFMELKLDACNFNIKGFCMVLIVPLWN